MTAPLHPARLAAALSLALLAFSSAQAQTYHFQTVKPGLVVAPVAATPSSSAGSSTTTAPSTTTPAAPAPAPVTAVDLTTTSLVFADTAVGATAGPGGVGVLNTGETVVSLSTPQVSGPFAASTDCTASLAAGGQCLVNVTFTPYTYGQASGTLTLGTTAGAKSVQLAGTGLASSFAVTSSSGTAIVYPQTYVGYPQPTVLTAMVANQGNIAGTLSLPTVTGVNASDFTASSDCKNVQAGQSCTATLSFTPQSAGTGKTASFSLLGWTAQLKGDAFPAPTKGVNFAALLNGARILNPTNTAYYGPAPYNTSTDTNCANTQWFVSSVLCANNTVGTQSYNANAATTWSNSNPSGASHYVVIDLGGTRTFNTAYVYQSPSDGRFTKVQLAVSNSPLPYADAGWSVVAPEMTVSDTVYTPQRMGFADVTGRYVRLQVRHTGTVNFSWVEIRGLQLFFE
jgi:hypothetical protein